MEFEALDEKARVEYVRNAVKAFQTGDRMKRAKEQRAYYETDNPGIKGRKRMYAGAKELQDGTIRAVATENKFAANEKVASSFFKDITDAKVQYLAGEGVGVTAAAEGEEAAAAVTKLMDGVTRQLRRVEQACLTDALVYGSGFAYVQVIENRIKFQRIPYCEVVPVYDSCGGLENAIRVWRRDGVDFAEMHTPEKVYRFKRNPKDRANRGWQADGERWQIETAMVYGDGTVEATGGRGWPRLPWFEMHHDEGGESSLTNAAKTMIRCYDIVVSDFANNLIDLQDAFVKLKDGYGSGQDFGEVLDMVKKFKASQEIEDVKTFEVPHQAREALLDRLSCSIYKALRGVDLSRMVGGQRTATEIKALYSDQDLWADQAEWLLEDWVHEVLAIVAHHKGMEMPAVNVTFQRRIMADEAAQMQAVASQKGIISDKTLLENHPLVTDAQAEMERIAAQELDPSYSLGV